MVKIWLVCFLILGFAYQSLATLETLQDEVTLLKGAFQRQIDELTKQVYALREEVDGLEKENFKKDQGKTLIRLTVTMKQSSNFLNVYTNNEITVIC